MDFHKMDQLFAVATESSTTKRPGASTEGATDTKRKKENNEVRPKYCSFSSNPPSMSKYCFQLLLSLLCQTYRELVMRVH